MLKPLVLAAMALTLSLSGRSQLRPGLAVDYEHIKAPAFGNIGTGSAWGGSIFFRYPFPRNHRLSLDFSFDFAGGNTSVQYYIYVPDPNTPMPIGTQSVSLVYVGIPVYLTYSRTFGHLRVFAGAGPSFASYSAGEVIGHGFYMKPNFTAITASFKAGCELFDHLMLSGEIRPWKGFLGRSGVSKVDNMLSVKLGYEFAAPTKHSRRKRSNT
ncbi:outer membrane beta-barrel protein [Puia sp. P3]|uniref:outer membrane beta-barrel protein n=1 Tax=Puia sp. P3 TaxID=3423952 RepID=UPI003D6714C1